MNHQYKNLTQVLSKSLPRRILHAFIILQSEKAKFEFHDTEIKVYYFEPKLKVLIFTFYTNSANNDFFFINLIHLVKSSGFKNLFTYKSS